MGTTVLVPTDFKNDAIDRLKVILQAQNDQCLNVILIHGIYLSNSISELLFFDEMDLKLELAGRDFLKQLDELVQELSSKMESIRLVLFTGFTQSAFDQFAEANRVDRIIIPTGRKLDCSHKKSKDILPFLQQSKVSKQRVALEIKSFLNASLQIKQI